jgi:copper(I)-binding protein
VSRNNRRAVAIAVAGVFAVAPTVTACAAGRHPQTAMPSQLAEGVNASAHQIDVRNAFVLGPEPGRRLAAGVDVPLYAWFVNHASTPDRLVAVEASGVAQGVQITGGGLELTPGKLVTTAQGAVTPPTATGRPIPGSPGTRTPKPGQTPSAPIRRPLAPGSASPSASGKAAPGSATPLPTPSSNSGFVGLKEEDNASVVVLKGIARELAGGESLKLTLHFQQAGLVTLLVPVVPRGGYYATYAPAPVSAPPSLLPQKISGAPTAGSTVKKPKKVKKPTPAPSA